MACNIFVFTAFVTYNYLCFANGQSVNSTRGDENTVGTCKSLYECKSLLNLFKKPDKTQADIDFLRNSKCGYEGNIPKVYCPDLRCYTPVGRNGTCTNIYSCPHLLSLLRPPIARETVQYVANSRCSDNNSMRVCCEPVGATRPEIIRSHCSSTVSFSLPPNSTSGCCGVNAAASDKIGGGTIVLDKHPWVVIIEYIQGNDIKLLCGGSLISGRYVLTAAHCVVGPVLNIGTPKNVLLGEYDITHNGQDCVPTENGAEDCNDGTIRIPIDSTIPYPGYITNIQRSPSDIALIRLQQTAPYTDFIRPICLPTQDSTLTPPEYFPLYVSGWGAASTQLLSDVKKEAILSFVEKNECQLAYTTDGQNVNLTSGQICASKDSCNGESGGPLMYENGNTWEVIGVLSFGPTSCDQPNLPAVYTKVYYYNDWIRTIIVH